MISGWNVKAAATAQNSNSNAGGLIGYSANCTITKCYATGYHTGNVIASSTGSSSNAHSGGLAGSCYSSTTFSNCYATKGANAANAIATGIAYAGGFTGYLSNTNASNCYATGNALASATSVYSGGFAGYQSGGTTTNCYSNGSVSASTGSNCYAGGFLAYANPATYNNCFWDTQTSGRAASATGAGKTTAQMKQRSTFTNWNFSTIWTNIDGVTYPSLQALITYNITFSANGGSGTMASQTYTHNVAQQLSANTFTRSGYAFTGWNTAASGNGTSYTNQQSVAITTGMTLYAQWASVSGQTFTVSFNANGGSGTMASQTFTGGVAQALNANAFTRPGLYFSGWNTTANGSGTSYANQQSSIVTANTTLYAQWTSTPTTHTVTFNANGGSGTMATQSFTAGVAQTLRPNSFTQSGVYFTGWNTNAVGSGTSYADQESITVTANMTLYAQWTSSPTTYTVTFNVNGGSGAMATQSFTAGVAQALRANTFTRTGYVFYSWNTSASGAGTSYTNQQSIAVSSNMTLYAIWASATTTLTITTAPTTLAGRGGVLIYGAGTMVTFDGEPKTVSINTGVSYTITFNDITGYMAPLPVSGFTSGGTIEIHGEYVAKNQTYTVAFIANGGTGTMTPQIFALDTPQALSNNTFTRVDYIFAGWNTNASGTGTSYANQQVLTISATTVLYAQWTLSTAISLATALDNSALTWSTSGSVNWGGQATTSYYGGSAAKSGAITHSQISALTTTATGPGTLKFYWKVSSEANKDELSFWINGVEKDWISGTVDWAQKTYTLAAGTNVLLWQYKKDLSASSGSDCGWVDKVEWTSSAPTYTVTFNANSGNGTMAAQTYTASVAKALSANAFTRTNYTFAGWNTNAAGTGTNYTNQQSITVSANMTLYAKWTLNTYTITYNANGGVGTMAPQVFTHGISQPLTANTFTRAGYAFTAWNREADGSGAVLVDKRVTAPTLSFTLYAQWTDNVGSVRVTLQGANGAQWRISGVCPWTSSGVAVANIAVGTYTVEFSAVTGYATPASQQVTVTKNGTATLTVDYRKSAVDTSEALLY